MFISRENVNKEIYKAISSVPILILIGARQVGKTTILKNLKFDLPSLYLIGQDPEIAEIFQKLSTAENYLKINLNEELKGFLLIDEFQFINNISQILKLLTDKHTELKIICSGSSSLDIIQKVEESLAGRLRIINIYSLSFSEYLKFKDEKLFDLMNKYDDKTEDVIVNQKIHNYFDEYLVYGGMPRLALENNIENKIQILDDIYKTYLLRDVRSYVKNEDSIGFNKLLILLAAQNGNMVNKNELSNSSGLSYRKCVDYIYLLEQMFIIKLVDPYFTNKRKVITKMRKVYFTDLGMRNIIYGDFNNIERRKDNGSLFENYVFLELMRKIPSYSRVYYYRTKDGTEIDFIVDNLKNKFLIEAKFKNISKELNLRNLNSFNEIESYKNAYIINKNFNLESKNIKFIQGYLMEKLNIN